jgi:methylmalonyl-CoA mutase, N-terminal domain
LLALRTQQLIAYESEVTDTVDPLGGSYYLEWLTNELEQRARDYLNKIDDMGGAIEAIERGFMQREIHNAAFAYQREIESKERIVVGVNSFTSGYEPAGDILKVNPAIEEKQRNRVTRVRTERDQRAAQTSLARIEQAARDGSNLMPPIIDAVRAWATLGEIADAMRRVFGEYQPANEL